MAIPCENSEQGKVTADEFIDYVIRDYSRWERQRTVGCVSEDEKKYLVQVLRNKGLNRPPVVFGLLPSAPQDNHPTPEHRHTSINQSSDNKIIAIMIIMLLAFVGATYAYGVLQENNLQPISPTRPLLPTPAELETIPTEINVEIQPTATIEIPPIDLSGFWYLEMNYRGYTDSTGAFTNHQAYEAWDIMLDQNGRRVSGTLLDVYSDYDDACVEANIDGSFEDGYLYLTILFTGSCCPNEMVEITGQVSDDGYSFQGSYQPVNIPNVYCTLSTGEVIGTKR
jgi:hypothetical protein